MNNSRRLKWKQSIKEGSWVEDCRYKVVRVKEIEKEYGIHPSVWDLIDTISGFFGTYDYEVNTWLHRKCLDIFPYFNFMFSIIPLMVISDAYIITEDGHGCSLSNCCDDPRLKYKH